MSSVFPVPGEMVHIPVEMRNSWGSWSEIDGIKSQDCGQPNLELQYVLKGDVIETVEMLD